MSHNHPNKVESVHYNIVMSFFISHDVHSVLKFQSESFTKSQAEKVDSLYIRKLTEKIKHFSINK